MSEDPNLIRNHYHDQRRMQPFKRVYPFLQGVTIRQLQPGQYLPIALLGDGRSGKSTYIQRFVTGQFYPQYQPTQGIHTTSMTLTVESRGMVAPVSVILNEFGSTYITPNEERIHLDEVGLATLRACRVALVFFDGTLPNQEGRVRRWLQLCDGLGIPTILVASHQDEPVAVRDDRHRRNQVRQHPSIQLITKLLWHPLPGEPIRCGFCVSSRSNYNLDKPVSWALARYYGDENLCLRESIPTPLPARSML